MQKSISGSMASVKINGVKVAFIGSVDLSKDIDLFRVEVLDQLDSAEIATVGIKAEATLNLIKIDNNAAAAIGLDFANPDDLLSNPEITLELYNRIGDKVIASATGCAYGGGSGRLDARGVYQGSYKLSARFATL